MDKHTQHLIDELLAIDPTLGEREGFSRAVETMIRVKPKVRLRPDFERELRSEILANIPVKKVSSFTWFSWKNLSYFSTGLAFAAFAIFAYRQLDFWPSKNNIPLPTPAKIQTPALGGVMNRSLPESSLSTTSDLSRAADNMAAVRNISPKNPGQTPVAPQKNIARETAPKAPEPNAQPEALAQKSAPAEPSMTALTAPAPTPTQDGSTADSSLMYGGAPTSSSPMMAKIAASSVRFAFSGELPAFDPMQSVTITTSGSVTEQDFPAKSLEVIRDEIAKGWYYRDDFAFDGTVRNLEKPRIESIVITKNDEKYMLDALVLDVTDAAADGPKTVTVMFAEGF